MGIIDSGMAAVLAICLLVPGHARSENVSNPSDARVAPRATPNPALDILSAAYGLRGTKMTCIATQAVKRRCQGQLSCEISTTQPLCPPGEKPPSVLISTLTVTYLCMQNDTVRRQVATARPFSLRISCASILRH